MKTLDDFYDYSKGLFIISNRYNHNEMIKYFHDNNIILDREYNNEVVFIFKDELNFRGECYTDAEYEKEYEGKDDWDHILWTDLKRHLFTDDIINDINKNLDLLEKRYENTRRT